MNTGNGRDKKLDATATQCERRIRSEKPKHDQSEIHNYKHFISRIEGVLWVMLWTTNKRNGNA